MTKCGDCIYYSACKSYVDENECFPEVGGCEAFKNKADFVEVKHGKWQLGRRGRKIVCSKCETAVPFKKDKYHIAWYSDYCPNCGAKMYGERKDT